LRARLAPGRVGSGHRRNRLHRRLLGGPAGHPVRLARPQRRAARSTISDRRSRARRLVCVLYRRLPCHRRRQPGRPGAVNAYLPHDSTVLAWVATALAGILLLGFGVSRMRSLSAAGCLAWLLVAASVFGVERVSAEEPAGFRMVAIIVALLWALKAVVSV